MVPTLFGPSVRAACPRCGQPFLFDAQSLDWVGEQVVCSLCGERKRAIDFSLTKDDYPGDVVYGVWPTDGQQVRRGDLVAFHWEGAVRVKRVAALPGEAVNVVDGRLRIDGKRLEDRLLEPSFASIAPRLVVDEDERREQTRWRQEGEATAGNGQWQRNDQRIWSFSGGEDSPWLVYHHRNVHDHDLPAGVLDDYQYNAAVARQLWPVDRLLIMGKLKTAVRPKMLVAFWTEDGGVVVKRIFDKSREFQYSVYDGEPAEGIPVTRKTPLAVRIVGGPATIQMLKISRFVEYRGRETGDRNPYPLKIPSRHYYLVGDNVPFSVDSRNFGPVPESQILGRIEVTHEMATGTR